MALDNKFIGLQIKRLRTKRNISQEALAELIGHGMDKSYISRIETGKREVRLDALVSIANALKVNVDEILTFHIDQHPRNDEKLYSILDGCSFEERRVILETVIALKNALKEASFKTENDF